MTIESTDGRGAHCAWFDKAEYKTAYIQLDALAKYRPSDKERPYAAELGQKLA